MALGDMVGRDPLVPLTSQLSTGTGLGPEMDMGLAMGPTMARVDIAQELVRILPLFNYVFFL